MRVIELRNYRLREGATREFIRYFEEHFLLSQRAEGMHPLGQFEVVDEPDRFVWIRGFEDMQTRLRGLTRFYDGSFWQAHRSEANAMMLEHHDVHLLRPLGSVAALTGGLTLENRASEPPGAVPSHTGLVAVDFYRARPAVLSHLVDVFAREVGPALVTQGHNVLGHFVTELTPNDYPRLPAIQDPALLLVLSAYRDREHCALMRKDWSPSGPSGAAGLDALLAGNVATFHLRPTARSLIRYQGEAAR